MKKKTVLALLLAMSMIFTMTACGGGGSSESSGSGDQSAQAAGSGISFQTTDLDGNAVDSKELFAKNKITTRITIIMIVETLDDMIILLSVRQML